MIVITTEESSKLLDAVISILALVRIALVEPVMFPAASTADKLDSVLRSIFLGLGTAALSILEKQEVKTKNNPKLKYRKTYDIRILNLSDFRLIK